MTKAREDLPESALRIHDLRERTALSQIAFAAYLHGIPVCTVRDWEYGRRVPPPYVLAFIAEKVNRDFPQNAEEVEKWL